MAHPDILYPPPHHPSNHVLHSIEYEQLEAYNVPEDDLDQPIHFAEQPAYISPAPSTDAPANQPAPFAQYTSLVGRTITSPSGGRFRLAFRRVLGVGAYGVVYLAEEIEREETRYSWFNPSAPSSRHEREPTISTAGRMYAVKVMRCAPRGSRQRAFQAREVALHRKADGHPGIVPMHAVYGTGAPPTWSPRKRKAWNSHAPVVRREDELTWDRDAELSGGPLPVLENGMPEELVYMVLSYVGGGDLFTMIAERQRYIGDDPLIKSVFVQLLDAVEWCHARGVRHRDLKPENVLCEEDGRTVLISDFGLATTDKRSRDFGCGSSYYMSPECYGDPLSPAKSQSYDTSANDVWTLGVVLVNLATGRNPWEAASPLDPTFTSFCADPENFLMSILPITPAANAVLVRVFDQDQSTRCSVSELREMVLKVKRWTLRGSELDGAGEGARDVARGCGLLDAPVERDDVEMGRAGSNGSTGMVERSRFSEDTVLDREDELEEDEEEWSMYGAGMGRARSESVCSSTSASSEMNRSRPLSKILSNSPTLMGPTWDQSEPEPEVDDQLSTGTDPVSLKARPESIPRWPKIVQGWDVVDSDSEAPRTPPMGVLEVMPAVEAATPRAVATTPRAGTGTKVTPRAAHDPSTPHAGPKTTPREIVVKDSTPRTETRLKVPGGVVEFGVLSPNSTLRTPRSTPSLKAPRSTPTLQAPKSGARLADISRSSSGSRSPVQRRGLLSSPFASKIPRYTGSTRTRTVSFEPPSRLAAKEAGRERMRSAPSPGHGAVPTKEKSGGLRPKVSFGDLSTMAIARLRSKTSARELRSKESGSTLHSRSSTRELHTKGSISTIASSVSSGFPVTPFKADVILASPRVIVSHPSDNMIWDIPRSSGSSLWDASSSHTTHYSGETHGEVPIHRPLAPLEPGAPLYDAAARLVDPNTLYRTKAWGMSSPSLSRTRDEEPAPAAEPVFARWRNIGSGSPRAESGGSPSKRKIKRVPVPPIPSELLEEHERQMTLKRNGTTTKMFELTVEAPEGKVAPPPGLALDDRTGEYRPGPKRLLENARAWFRRI